MAGRTVGVLAGIATLVAVGIGFWGAIRGEATPERPPGRVEDAVQRPENPPHVVLVLGCTLRKDQTSLYGGPADTTPYLAELGARGVVFDDVIASAPWTRSAAVAILTGHPALSLGMVEPSKRGNRRRLADSVTLLSERFADAGYVTIGGSANPNLRARFGFGQGFDAYKGNVPAGFDGKVSAEELVDGLLPTLREARRTDPNAPVYMQVMFIEAHAPRTPSRNGVAQFASNTLPDAVVTYRAALREFDDAVRALAADLVTEGLTPDNTVFVVVSDHGEGLRHPRHHPPGHGLSFAPSVVEGVWTLAGPGVARGHRIEGLVSQLDVLPTLLGVVGLPAEPEVSGYDLSAQVRGSSAVSPRKEAYSDTWFRDMNAAAVFTPTRACQHDFGVLSSGRWRRTECFDRRDDPSHRRPFADPVLDARIVAWRRSVQTAAPAEEAAPPDAELRMQLERLGYAEAGGTGP